MTSDLFPDCKMDSPRLAWMKRRGIAVRNSTDADCTLSEFIAEKQTGECYHIDYIDEDDDECDDGDPIYLTGEGETEDEAIADLAVKMGIPLWNEEAYQQEKEK